MILSAYSLAVASIYALLYVASPDTANALMLFFVIAALLPALAMPRRRR